MHPNRVASADKRPCCNKLANLKPPVRFGVLLLSVAIRTFSVAI